MAPRGRPKSDVLQLICVFLITMLSTCASIALRPLNIGRDSVYKVSARKLGGVIGAGNKVLVYGGGNIGLMGEIARAVLDTSPMGDDAVVGFIPARLADREVSGNLLGRTRIVNDMHERKAAMAAEAEAFIAMPGGFGTMEEVLEMITWQQLGYHTKPVGLLNVNGFFDSLLAFFDNCVAEVRRTYGTWPGLAGRCETYEQIIIAACRHRFVRAYAAEWHVSLSHDVSRRLQGFISQDCRHIVVVSASAEDLLDKLEAYEPPTSVVDRLKQQSQEAQREKSGTSIT